MTPRDQQLRKFGLAVGGVFLGIALFSLYRKRVPTPTLFFLGPVGALLIFTGLLVPKALAPVERVWMRLAAVLGWINTRILLGVVFFFVLFPVSLVMRMLRKDPLDRSWQEKEPTYWKTYSSDSTLPDRYQRQF